MNLIAIQIIIATHQVIFLTITKIVLVKILTVLKSKTNYENVLITIQMTITMTSVIVLIIIPTTVIHPLLILITVIILNINHIFLIMILIISTVTII